VFKIKDYFSDYMHSILTCMVFALSSKESLNFYDSLP